jgi:hypothetical protein
LARALDDLDEDHYVDFDTSEIPVLIIAKQEVERYSLEELRAGLISVNEYRIITGRKEVEADLADSLLANPNLTPIANTKKAMQPPQQQGVPIPGAGGPPPGMPGMPGEQGMPPGAGASPGMGTAPEMGLPPGMGAPPQPDATTMSGAMALEAMGAGAPQPAAAGQMGAMSINSSEIQTKEDGNEMSISRWTEILDRSIERVLERMQRVVLEKMSGQKSRKALISGSLDVESFVVQDVWTRQLDEDVKPVLSTIIRDSQSVYQEKTANYAPPAMTDVSAHIDSQMSRIKEIIGSISNDISTAVFNSYGIHDEDGRYSALRSSVNVIFSDAIANFRPTVSAKEAKRAWDFARP